MTRIEQYIGGQMHDFQDLEYDLANRLWKKCRVTYENDANGNRTSRTLDSRVLNYQYDGENRLTQVLKNGVDVLDNVYDGAGMRIKEVKGGKTTYFVYQGNNPLMEYTPGDGKYKYFIYASNKMVAEETDGVVKYYYQDHLGSTRVVTDAAGNKVAEYKFKPYGDKDSSSGVFSTDYQFTGKPLDTEVGLSYFGARFYDPETGRFLTQDPTKDGLNWYEYCYDNPLGLVDPDGECPVWVVTVTGGAIIGGIIGGGGNLISQLASNKGNWKKVSWGEVGVNTLTGMASGALTGSGAGLLTSILGNAALSGINYVAVQKVNGKEPTLEGIAMSQLLGAVAGGISGSGVLSGSSGKNIMNTEGARKLAQFLKSKSGTEINASELKKLLTDAAIVSTLRTIAASITSSVAGNNTNNDTNEEENL